MAEQLQQTFHAPEGVPQFDTHHHYSTVQPLINLLYPPILNDKLCYGGGSVGPMGMISQRVFDGCCHDLGIIPKALVPLEICMEGKPKWLDSQMHLLHSLEMDLEYMKNRQFKWNAEWAVIP